MSINLTFPLRHLPQTRLYNLNIRMNEFFADHDEVMGVSVQYFCDGPSTTMQPSCHLWHYEDDENEVLERDDINRAPEHLQDQFAAIGGWILGDSFLKNAGGAILPKLPKTAKRQVWEMILVRQGALLFHTNTPPLLGDDLESTPKFKQHYRNKCQAIHSGNTSAHSFLYSLRVLQEETEKAIKSYHNTLARALSKSDLARPMPAFSVTLEEAS